jgi:hypothetical protein
MGLTGELIPAVKKRESSSLVGEYFMKKECGCGQIFTFQLVYRVFEVPFRLVNFVDNFGKAFGNLFEQYPFINVEERSLIFGSVGNHQPIF